jgi:hypothetical protein
MQDKISGLEWSKTIQTSRTWPQAINDCAALTHNGASGWRLPTQKELMSAYEHGAISAASTNWITTAQMSSYFWSSSTLSFNTSNAWVVGLSNGSTSNNDKTYLLLSEFKPENFGKLRLSIPNELFHPVTNCPSDQRLSNLSGPLIFFYAVSTLFI